MLEPIKKEYTRLKLLINGIPAVITVLFVMSVFAMNLLANKSIALGVDWLALDCGIIVSWIAFLTMDIVTKHFGPRAATEMTAVAIAINLLFCLLFYVCGVIPGDWGESYAAGDPAAINGALDSTFGGTWYILLGSMTAFAVAAVINNFTNWGVGKAFKRSPDGAMAFFIRTYVSTAVGQFADNILFALIVSKVFFGWTIVQCVMCALTGMAAELVVEAAFSFLGYRICEKWKRDGVGERYFEYINGGIGE